jgi:uncharacterized protein (TIGR03437 family)
VIANDKLPRPQQEVRVFIGGREAEVRYAGAAPRLVAGVLQVNAVIPPGVSGNAEITLIVGDFVSQPGVTVAVR